MAEQLRKKGTEQEQQVEEVDAKAIGDVAAKGAEVKADIDALLDDIDKTTSVTLIKQQRNHKSNAVKRRADKVLASLGE